MDPKSKPCADMTLTTSLLSSVKDNSTTVTVSFDEMIDVSKEVIAFTFFQMVAEVKLYWKNVTLNHSMYPMPFYMI